MLLLVYGGRRLARPTSQNPDPVLGSSRGTSAKVRRSTRGSRLRCGPRRITSQRWNPWILAAAARKFCNKLNSGRPGSSRSASSPSATVRSGRLASLVDDAGRMRRLDLGVKEVRAGRSDHRGKCKVWLFACSRYPKIVSGADPAMRLKRVHGHLSSKGSRAAQWSRVVASRIPDRCRASEYLWEVQGSPGRSNCRITSQRAKFRRLPPTGHPSAEGEPQ
jgi:hypothetical protein